MQYSLYEYYNKRPLNLYEVRKHYLEHFYYQNHSRNEANNVLKSVVASSKVGILIKESLERKIVPTYTDFLTAICSMFKFMFRSNETTALATIEAALRWDIEVNQEHHLISSEELKQELIKVFAKFSIYEEMSDAEFYSIPVISTVDAEIVEESKEDLLLEHKTSYQLKTWTLASFIKEFGNMKVGSFVNKTTGDVFKSCVCTKGRTRTFVAFSSKLGELTSNEIGEMKDELVVVKTPNGKYSLAKTRGGAWEDVNI